MKEEIDSFLSYLAKEKGFSHNTVAAYKNDINQFAAFVTAESARVGSVPNWSNLTARLVSDYRQELIEKRYRPTTLARKIAAIRCFLKFLLKVDKLPDEMEKGLALGYVGRILPKPLSISEVRRLLAEPAKRSSPEAKRDRAMMELLYATGLQVSELMSLNVADIDLKRGVVHCSGKSTRNRDIPIDASVTRVIKEYLDITRPELAKEGETALFVNRRGERLTRQGFWQILKEYGNKAGLSSKATPRALRHSFAAHKRKSGADLSSVQKMLGHAYLTTTKVYEKVK